MGFGKKALAAAVAGGLAAGTAAAQAPTSGPVAVYWVSAATTTGMQGIPGMGGMGAMGGRPGMGSGQRPAPQSQAQPPRRPGLGAMMGMAVGGGALGIGPFGRREPPPQQEDEGESQGGSYRGGSSSGGGYGMGGGGQVSRSLDLQLGSTQAPTGAPQAAHFVPAGLRTGDSLPLVTPQVRPPEPPEPGAAPQMGGQRPKGRMLIYWGCGEHAQGPITIDFARMSASNPPHIPFIAANPGRPPSAGRYATYGQWPNDRSSVAIPPGGSLIGEHTIKGDYSPDIHFALAPGQDFLGPLRIVSHDPTPVGGTKVTWDSVSGATGYYAWMVGAEDKGETVVMWSSGSTASMMGALTDYLPPAEVRRLVTQGAVMSPETTSCVVPSEVVKAAPFGMLSMIAYGQESDFADPPRPLRAGAPWNLRWTVKVRRKSTTTALLGLPSDD